MTKNIKLIIATFSLVIGLVYAHGRMKVPVGRSENWPNSNWQYCGDQGRQYYYHGKAFKL